IMTDQERRDFVENMTGIELVNELMRLAEKMHQYDVVCLLGSTQRIRLMAALVDAHRVVPFVLGETPLTADVFVDIQAFGEVLRQVRKENNS
ncbi:MAG: transcriptional regulator, partial [Firmicutes bacterium]|nr:transcriptional regulator [Bacillota bacterium]